jgi:hypothetical protein
MKTHFRRILPILTMTGLVATFSCNKDDDNAPLRNTSDVKEEAVTDLYFQDVDDLGTVAINDASEEDYGGGRRNVTITINDHRFCEGTTVTIEPGSESTLEQPYGVLTVNFGTGGCADAKGNIRKGKVIFTYSGRRFMAGSSVVTTVENYSINGILIEGVRTSTNVTGSTEDAPTFHATLEDGVATFPDQTTAERESDIVWSWERAQNPLNDKLIIEEGSEAHGTTRNGTEYEVLVSSQLEYTRVCPIAITGVKQYVFDGETEVALDYGDGDCDRVITLMIGENSRTIAL